MYYADFIKIISTEKAPKLAQGAMALVMKNYDNPLCISDPETLLQGAKILYWKDLYCGNQRVYLPLKPPHLYALDYEKYIKKKVYL